VPHVGAEAGPARVVMATVTVSVWLALSDIAWSHGEHQFRRRGFCLPGAGGRVLSLSVKDAGRERDDSADEDERNGPCEQATSPDPDRSHLRSAPQG
jgi:hypothetical protein